MGDVTTLTVLTYDAEHKVYKLYEFNSMGRGDAAKGTVDGDTWTFDGESKMGDKLIKTRYTIKLPSPDSAVMRSEVSMEGGPMTLLMELKGSRVKQSSSNFSSRKLASTIGQPRRTCLIPVAASYELQVADADFRPAMNPAISKAVHTHSGPEIWYVLTGAQCLETRNGIQHAKAGEGMFAPANTPMQLDIAGTGNREAFFTIVHDAAKPATAVSDWQPKGDCQK